MGQTLNLRDYFPAVLDQQWQDLMPNDLSWQPIEGGTIQPYYRRGKLQPAPVFEHRDWLIRTDIELEDAGAAIDAGAEALGFMLRGPSPIPAELPLGRIPMFFYGEAIDAEFLQSLCAGAARNGYQPAQLRGAVIFSEPQSSQANLQAAQGTGLWTECINLETWHDQGATHVQEMACALAQLSDLMTDLAPRCSAEHIYVRVPVGERYLLDIARLRALRLCARQVLHAYSVGGPDIPIVGVPSRRYESVLDPDTHLIRQTLQCTAAILGGCNVVVSTGIGLSLHMQHLLRYEGKLNAVADATAGSWMIEHLTNAFGQAAWELFQRIETEGGLQKTTPWITKQIQDADRHRKSAVYSGNEKVVGINTYLSDQIRPAAPQPQSIAASLEQIRLRANKTGSHARVVVQGGCNHPWLQRLLDLCACTIQTEAADLTVTKTMDGFQIRNLQGQEIRLTAGESLPLAADRLLKLLETYAP